VPQAWLPLLQQTQLGGLMPAGAGSEQQPVDRQPARRLGGVPRAAAHQPIQEHTDRHTAGQVSITPAAIMPALPAPL
jgi:hypothetical protein